MTYYEALAFIEENGSLVGEVNDKGFVVSQLIIVPKNIELRKKYLSNFLHTSNHYLDESLLENQEVEVWAVDTTHLDKANILFYNKLG